MATIQTIKEFLKGGLQSSRILSRQPTPVDATSMSTRPRFPYNSATTKRLADGLEAHALKLEVQEQYDTRCRMPNLLPPINFYCMSVSRCVGSPHRHRTNRNSHGTEESRENTSISQLLLVCRRPSASSLQLRQLLKSSNGITEKSTVTEFSLLSLSLASCLSLSLAQSPLTRWTERNPREGSGAIEEINVDDTDEENVWRRLGGSPERGSTAAQWTSILLSSP